jgi:outer membrane protein
MRILTKLRSVLCVATLLAASPLTQAQNLSELLDTARSYDAAYLAARALADSAQYKAEQALALRRPSVGASVSTTLSQNDAPTTDLRSRTAGAGLSAKQSLYNPVNSRTIQQAQHQLEIAQIELQAAEQELILRVAQTYFDVLSAGDNRSTARASKTAIAEQLASAKRNFDIGTATITDAREAQARFDLASAQEIAADNDWLTKRLALDQLVGRSQVQPHPIRLPLPLTPLEPSAIDSWVAQTTSSPSVRRAQLAMSIAELETQKAKAGHLPSVDLEGGYQQGHSHIRGKQGSFPANSAGPTSQSTLGLTLKLPLFAGYAIDNRVKETLALQAQSQNILEAAQRSSAQATRAAYFSVQSLGAQIRALEAAETSTKLALEATQLGYKVGVRVNVDVLNAQTQLYTTQRDLAKARYELLLGRLKLRLACGQLDQSDVQALNRMLTL